MVIYLILLKNIHCLILFCFIYFCLQNKNSSNIIKYVFNFACKKQLIKCNINYFIIFDCLLAKSKNSANIMKYVFI